MRRGQKGWENPTVWGPIKPDPWNTGRDSNSGEEIPLLSACLSEAVEERVPLMDNSLFRTVGPNPFTTSSVNPFLPTLGKEEKTSTVTHEV